MASVGINKHMNKLKRYHGIKVRVRVRVSIATSHYWHPLPQVGYRDHGHSETDNLRKVILVMRVQALK